ncbi:MAG TPA: RNA pyrophosphohydrolase, partial [Caulobacteraceae bacterium]
TAKLIGQTNDWLAYEFPPDHAGSKVAKGWVGQKQIWFAMRFLGAESEIDLTGHHHIEFDAWRWADLAETPDLVAGFKEATYRKVVEIFTPMLATAL